MRWSAMPLTLVVRTDSTARRSVGGATYCSIDSTRSRRFDLNAGDRRAITSRSSPTKSNRQAMATGIGSPSTVWPDKVPINDVSDGEAWAGATVTDAPGAGAPLAVDVAVGEVG